MIRHQQILPQVFSECRDSSVGQTVRVVTLTFGSPFLHLLLGARVEQNTFSLFYKFEKSFEGSCNVFPVCYADLFFKIVCGMCVRGVCVCVGVCNYKCLCRPEEGVKDWD